MLSFDTETCLIESAKLAPELSCLTWSDGESCGIAHWTDSYAQARNLLEQEVTTANGSYDLAVLWAAFPDLKDLIWDGLVKGRYHDVLSRQKLLDVGQGVYRRVFRRLPGADKPTLLRYSLSDLHARYYGQPMEKDEWRLRYGELRPLPLEQWPQGAIKYAQYDAVATARIHDLQNAAAVEQGHTHNLWDEAPQVRAAFALHLASCWGFRTDLKQVEKVIGQIDNEQPGLARKLLSVGLVRESKGEYTRSEKLAKSLMYSAVGDAGELTDTGYKKVKAGELTKDEALRAGYIQVTEEWCEVSNKPELIAYYQFRQNQLLRAKLAHIQIAAFYSIPIQTSFEVLMETGRTSSSENKLIRNSMALQNPPRKGGMRECFVARPGCTLIACDYGQAELVALAQITYAAFGYSRMRDLINEKRDLHVDFGKEILAQRRGVAISYEEAWRLHKAKDPVMKEMRQMAKVGSFGLPGGLGWASLQSYARKAWGVILTGEESKQLKMYWLRHFPEMRDYFKWMSELIEAGNGRADIQQYMSGRWRGKCYYTQASNTMFQGLTADAAKSAFFEISRLCYSVRSSNLYGCRPLLFLHDEIITEAPKEQAAEAAVEKERVMIEIYRRYTPDVQIGADAHLMDRWSKDAEAIHDERGKLVPWSPPQDDDERFEG
jgi:hypothetical protein